MFWNLREILNCRRVFATDGLVLANNPRTADKSPLNHRQKEVFFRAKRRRRHDELSSSEPVNGHISMRYNHSMSSSATATGDQLASALDALGIQFIMGGQGQDRSLHKRPARLIAALAGSNEARLRLALIPLFLQHPEFAPAAGDVAKDLAPAPRLLLQCYYTAAFLLQKQHQSRLNRLFGEKPLLPNLFGRELGIDLSGDPEDDLQLLASRHQVLSGAQINWLGTYQHAMEVWLKGLRHRRRAATT